MLSTAIEESFVQLAAAIASRSAASFRESGALVSHRFYEAGQTGYSSRHVVELCKVAIDAFDAGAGETYRALMTACEAQPIRNVETRAGQLENLLDLQLIALGDTVTQALNGQITPMMAQAANHAMIAAAPAQLREAIAGTRSELKARLQIDVRKGTSATAQTLIHIGDNAIIGALQSGTYATATFTQTVNRAGREELKAAVDELIAVVRASNAPTADQREIIDVLHEVKVEADKAAPNKLKIGGALSVTGAAVSVLANGPAAYANVMASWEALQGLLCLVGAG